MSEKKLLIVESPAKAKTIGKYLGPDYIIRASMGHVRDLPEKAIGVDIENGFQPQYVVDRTKLKQKVIAELREMAAKAGEIFLASDHDREGEAIAWHLAELLKKEISGKPVHRIIFNEITKPAIVGAVKSPGVIDMNKVDAQQARRVLDRLVGYKVSKVLWQVISGNLSAGRVQSVALRLICEREQEILSFVPEEYWSLEAMVRQGKLKPFRATLEKWDGKKPRIGSEAEAMAIYSELTGKPFILDKVDRGSRKVQPPAPFITSTLQQEASKILNFSPKKTMMLAQELYEGVEVGGESAGLITYMRTDSVRIADEANENCRQLVTQRFGNKALNSKTRTFSNKNAAQDAHEAIRPTDSFKTPEEMEKFLSRDLLKLYTLIWQRFVATQMKPAELDTVSIGITAGKGLFTASGSTLSDKGFLLAYPHISVSLGEEIDPGYLALTPPVTEPPMTVEKLEQLQHFTKPPSRFTEASIIKELESLGIGRPSTYAAIISTILTRKYVELKEKKFSPTDLGNTVNQFLVKNFDRLFNVKFTAEMETGLDDIEYGKEEWRKLVGNYWGTISDLLGNVDKKSSREEIQEKTDVVCEKCGRPMVLKWGKRGQILACSGYPECSNIKSFTKQPDGSIKVVEPRVLSETCPTCGSPLMERHGRFGAFTACSNYPKCKYIKKNTIGIKCPLCGTGDIRELKSKKGSPFYGCTSYPTCKFISNGKPIAQPCPNCGSPYMEIRQDKQGANHLYCAKCKHKENNPAITDPQDGKD